MDFEPFPRIDARGTGLERQLANRIERDIGSPTVSDQVDLFYLGETRNQLQDLPQVVHGEFARLPIIGVAERSRVAGWPSVDDRHADSAEEMPEFGHREDGIVEAVLEAIENWDEESVEADN